MLLRFINSSICCNTIDRKRKCKKGRLQPSQFRVNKMNSVSCGLETEVKKNKNTFKKNSCTGTRTYEESSAAG